MRTRFAPAPTGWLHLGHVLNAEYVWNSGGEVLLRIEDHDRERCRPDYEAGILDDLDWLGYRPDIFHTDAFRAGVCDGRQSDRESVYREAVDVLQQRRMVYACDCTRRAIEERGRRAEVGGRRVEVGGRDAEGAKSAELHYDGHCSHRGLPLVDGYGWRVRIEPGVERFVDGRLGAQEQDPSAQCGDVLIRDRLGNWTYQFAVSVDDFRQGIDLVIRGEDLLASTGRQIHVARLLGRERPATFLHHGLIMKSPGQKLSKSDGDTGIRELRARGWTPQQVRNAVRASDIGHQPSPIGSRTYNSLFPGAIMSVATSVEVLENYVGGKWTRSQATAFADVHNPARGEVIAKTPLSTRADLDAAVAAAAKAFPAWRDTPVVVRARAMFRFAHLLEQHFEELARTVTTEHGKTIDESRGSVRRGIECVEVACGAPSLMMGHGLEQIATNVDCTVFRQPLGVVAAITPFNFPAMVPLWFLPFAVATGNTVIVKPSEQVPLSARMLFKLLAQCDVPAGVINLVNGGREVVEGICDHPGIRAVSFVGSTSVARTVYQRGTHAGKRVQALGGAKNFVVIMPDANFEKSIDIITESFYGCAGERCLAGSVLVPVGEAHKEARERLVESARSLKVGDGLDAGVKMGPVISGTHRDRVKSYIDQGVKEGAKLVLDGRGVKVAGRDEGFFLGPTVFDEVSPDMKIGREEVFGPVASIRAVGNLDEAIALMHAHPNANATSIFTSSGKAAREFARHATASMVGVNIGVAAPMAYFPFGGAKDSFFGDLKVHGRDAFEFYTDKKVTITRWL